MFWKGVIQNLVWQTLKRCLRALASPKALGAFSVPEPGDPNPFRSGQLPKCMQGLPLPFSLIIDKSVSLQTQAGLTSQNLFSLSGF